LGWFHLSVETARARQDYDHFRHERAKSADIDIKAAQNPVVKHEYDLKKYDPGLDWKPEFSPLPGGQPVLPMAFTPMDTEAIKVSLSLPQYAVPGPAPMSEINFTFEMPIPASLIQFTVQTNDLIDDDVFGDVSGETFEDPTVYEPILDTLVEVAQELHHVSFEVPDTDQMLDAVKELADQVDAVQLRPDGEADGPENEWLDESVITPVVDPDQPESFYTNGELVTEMPELADLLPDFFQTDDGTEDGEDDSDPTDTTETEVEEETITGDDGEEIGSSVTVISTSSTDDLSGGTPDVPETTEPGHDIVTGANVLTNVSIVSSNWLDAGVIVVGEEAISLDVISQVNVLVNLTQVNPISGDTGFVDGSVGPDPDDFFQTNTVINTAGIVTKSSVVVEDDADTDTGTSTKDGTPADEMPDPGLDGPADDPAVASGDPADPDGTDGSVDPDETDAVEDPADADPDDTGVTEVEEEAPYTGGPVAVSVVKLTSDLIQLNSVQQFNFVSDNDQATVEFTAKKTFLGLGGNETSNTFLAQELGFGFDLIIVSGNMITLNYIQQTNVLLDLDTITYDVPLALPDDTPDNVENVVEPDLDLADPVDTPDGPPPDVSSSETPVPPTGDSGPVDHVAADDPGEEPGADPVGTETAGTPETVETAVQPDATDEQILVETVGSSGDTPPDPEDTDSTGDPDATGETGGGDTPDSVDTVASGDTGPVETPEPDGDTAPQTDDTATTGGPAPVVIVQGNVGTPTPLVQTETSPGPETGDGPSADPVETDVTDAPASVDVAVSVGQEDETETGPDQIGVDVTLDHGDGILSPDVEIAVSGGPDPVETVAQDDVATPVPVATGTTDGTGPVDQVGTGETGEAPPLVAGTEHQPPEAVADDPAPITDESGTEDTGSGTMHPTPVDPVAQDDESVPEQDLQTGGDQELVTADDTAGGTGGPPLDPTGSAPEAPGGGPQVAPPDTGTSPTGAGPTISAGDNLLLNKALITKTGVDTEAEITSTFEEALDDLKDGEDTVSQKVKNDDAFDGVEFLRVLYVDGDFLTVNSFEQTNVLGDSDQVNLKMTEMIEDMADDITVTTGSNVLANISIIETMGVDSTVMTKGGAYSDALIHQLELTDESAVPSGVQMSDLATEAVAFLAEGIIDSALSGMDDIDAGISPIEASIPTDPIGAIIA